MTGAAATAAQAAARIAWHTGVPRHDVAVVLGSGWAAAAGALGTPRVQIAMAELPGFAPPAVPGHAGVVRSVRVAAHDVLVLLGRTHLYEGHGVPAVVHGVRVAHAAGCSAVVLTNAAGSLDPRRGVGQVVLVRDHLDLTGRSALAGPPAVGSTDLYSARLRAVARAAHPGLVEGVYAGMPGPQFETPAEIGMLRTLGADLVGMSTVLEAAAARAAGAEVLALALVTNLAAGLAPGTLGHDEVLAAGTASASRLGTLLRAILERL